MLKRVTAEVLEHPTLASSVFDFAARRLHELGEDRVIKRNDQRRDMRLIKRRMTIPAPDINVSDPVKVARVAVARPGRGPIAFGNSIKHDPQSLRIMTREKSPVTLPLRTHSLPNIKPNAFKGSRLIADRNSKPVKRPNVSVKKVEGTKRVAPRKSTTPARVPGAAPTQGGSTTPTARGITKPPTPPKDKMHNSEQPRRGSFVKDREMKKMPGMPLSGSRTPSVTEMPQPSLKAAPTVTNEDDDTYEADFEAESPRSLVATVPSDPVAASATVPGAISTPGEMPVPKTTNADTQQLQSTSTNIEAEPTSSKGQADAAVPIPNPAPATKAAQSPVADKEDNLDALYAPVEDKSIVAPPGPPGRPNKSKTAGGARRKL